MKGTIYRITETVAKAKTEELLKAVGHKAARLYQATHYQCIPSDDDLRLLKACILGNVQAESIDYTGTMKDILIISAIDSFNMGRIRGIQQERKRRNKKK